MSFVTIQTLTSHCIKVDFGVYACESLTSPQYMNPHHIKRIRILAEKDPEIVQIESVYRFNTVTDEMDVTWELSSPPHNAFVVASIDGIAPTSAVDLAEKLAYLMA